MRRLPVAVFACALVVVGQLACGSEGPTAPVSEPAFDVTAPFAGALRAGASERLALVTPAEEPLLLYAEGLGGTPGDSLLVIVGTPDGAGELGRVAFSPVDGASGPAPLFITAFPVATRLPITVRGLRPSDRGSFRLRAEAPTDLPEHADALLQLGVEAVELHDGASDLDRFRVPVTAGRRYLLQVGKRGFPEARSISVAVRDANGSLGGRSELRSDHAPEQALVPFVPRVTGEVQITVTGPTGSASWYGGSYTLRIIESSLAPETASATIALNDTIVEAIDVVGDVDEFSFSGTAGTRFRIWPRLDRDVADSIRFTLYRGNSVVGVAGGTLSTDWQNAWPGDAIVLPATDTYRLVVTGPLDRLPEEATTPYAFVLSTTADAPESATALLPPGSLMVDESLFGCGDVDEFRIESDTTVTITIGVATTSTDGCALRAEVRSGPWSAALTVVSEANGDPDRRRMGPLVVGPGAPLVLQISAERSLTPSAGVTPYIVDVHAVNFGPEDQPELFTPGAGTFVETLDRCGDHDTFAFDVAAPAQLLLNIGLDRAVSCPGYFTVIGPVNLVEYRDVAVLPDGDPDASTWALTLPYAGRHTLVWTTTLTGSSADRGAALSITAELLSTEPEIAPVPTALGDTILGETIARCGDVDEFRFPVTAGEEVAVALSLGRDTGCDVTAEIVSGFFIATGVTTNRATTLTETQSPFAVLWGTTSGEYVLRVRSEGPGSSADRGTPYRVGVFRPNARPETVGDTLTVGDSVATEGIEVPGDRDDFYVFLEPDRLYAINVAGDVRVSMPTNGISIDPASPLLPMGIRSTGRFAVHTADYFRIRFQGADDAATGSYRFEIIEAVPAPEDVPAELPLGTWVTESLSPFFDRDEFFFRPDSTDWLMVSVERVGSEGGLDLFTSFASFGSNGRSTPFLGYNDSIPLTVSGLLYDPSTQQPGQYRVRVDVMDVAPEHVPATFAVGDTIRGESLGFVGDLDRFTTTIGETGRYAVAVRGTTGCLLSSFLNSVIQVPGTFRYSSAGFGNWTVNHVDAVAGDTLRITHHVGDPNCLIGDYEFVVTRAP